MDFLMVNALKNAGVKQETLEILQEEELDIVDVLKDAPDLLLKSCNIKAGQIVRIRKALACSFRVEDDGQILKENLMLMPPDAEPINPELPTCITVPLHALPPIPMSSSATLPGGCASSKDTHGPKEDPSKQLTSPGTSLLNSLNSSLCYGSYFLKKEGHLKKDWIKDFTLPDSYSLTVEDSLKVGRLSGTVRDEFTRNICIAISRHTMNPTKEERDRVALLIVQKYPFLEDTYGAGLGSWSSAIGNRFRNMRRTKKPAGTHRLKSEKLSPAPSAPKKRKLRNEMVVTFRDGETPETCAKNKKVMKQEMDMAGGKDPALISKLMVLTFPYRRQSVLLASKRVHDILTEYPALQLVSEIMAEFDRILSTSNVVIDMVDNYKAVQHNILNMATKSANSKVKNLLSGMENFLSEEPGRNTDIESTVSFLVLQLFLKEKAAEHNLFFSVCSDDELFDEAVNSTNYPRLVGCGNMSRLQPFVIAVEGKIVARLSGANIGVPMAVALLLSTFHIFNIEYTPGACSIFAFLEAIMLKHHEPGNKRVSVQKMLKEING